MVSAPPFQNTSYFIGIQILDVLEHLEKHHPNIPRPPPPPPCCALGWVVFLDEGTQGGKTQSLEWAQKLPLIIRNVLAFRIPPPQPQSAGDAGTRQFCQDWGAAAGGDFWG